MLSGIDALFLARAQFAFTLAFHIVLPAFSIGLASYLMVLEALWLRTGRQVYLDVFQYWLKIFALSFAMGVVSGLVMSYEFGTNWSGFNDLEFERLLAQYETTLDKDQRTRYIVDMMKRINDELPVYALYYSVNYTAMVSGLLLGPAGQGLGHRVEQQHPAGGVGGQHGVADAQQRHLQPLALLADILRGALPHGHLAADQAVGQPQ